MNTFEAGPKTISKLGGRRYKKNPELNPGRKGIKMWVARDADSTLWLHDTKPYIQDSSKGYYKPTSGRYFEIDSKLFPDLKWEDEPIEVVIKKAPG